MTRLAATEHELARTGAAIDRYLTAFENGTLAPEYLAGRPRPAQEQMPAASRAACRNQRKALIEALVAQVKITGPGRIVPFFRIPQSEANTAAEATCPWFARQPRPTRHSRGSCKWSNQWGRWDSNPHCRGPKPRASCRWATAPLSA